MQSELIHNQIRALARETGIKVFTFAEVGGGRAQQALCTEMNVEAHACLITEGEVRPCCAGCGSQRRARSRPAVPKAYLFELAVSPRHQEQCIACTRFFLPMLFPCFHMLQRRREANTSRWSVLHAGSSGGAVAAAKGRAHAHPRPPSANMYDGRIAAQVLADVRGG